MEVQLIAVGRARRGPEQALFGHYAERLRHPFKLIEVEEKRPLSGPELQEREATLLLSAVPDGAAVVALDERGKHLDSPAFARRLTDWRDQGVRVTAILIGGADGLTEQVRARADLVLCLGKMTWPHMLVRGLIAEQLYRAQQISAGHPYHRQ